MKQRWGVYPFSFALELADNGDFMTFIGKIRVLLIKQGRQMGYAFVINRGERLVYIQIVQYS